MRYRQMIFALLLFALNSVAYAEHINMVRVKQTFPETMLRLQELVAEHGYKLSRVQRVDIGLTKSGYQTDKYRVVFFAKHDEYRWMIANHPELIPYLPFKIAIYAEGKDTILTAYNPRVLFNTKSAKLQKIINQWSNDLESMFRQLLEYGEE